MNEFITLVSLLLHSPLIWIIVLSFILRCLFRPYFHREDYLTEKEYYHSLHTELQKLCELKLSGGKDKVEKK